MKLTREEVLELAQEAGLVTKIYDGGEFFELTDAQVASPILMKFAALLSVHLAKPLAESAVAPGECVSVPDEQAAFEAHIRMISPKLLFIERWPDGSYKHIEIEEMWKGWQARALLSAQRQDSDKDAERLDWLLDWYLRDGLRAEIDPLGHIRRTTKEIILAAVDIAIANGAPK